MSDVAAATDAGTAQAVVLETLARATETGAELSVPELADRAPAATGRMIAAAMLSYRIVPTDRFDRGCLRFTVDGRDRAGVCGRRLGAAPVRVRRLPRRAFRDRAGVSCRRHSAGGGSMQRTGIALVTLLVGSSASADAPPADRVVVETITVNGSGCPAGTAAVAVSPDNTAFSVSYGSYMAVVGVGARPTDFRKNCNLNLLIHVPPGFTFAIAAVDQFGFASLAAGASGVVRMRLFFQGGPFPPFVDHSLTGPFNDDWWFTDTVDPAALVFAPCDTQPHLNIATEVRATLGTSDPATTTSFMAMDGVDTLPHAYHLVWKRCG